MARFWTYLVFAALFFALAFAAFVIGLSWLQAMGGVKT